MLVKNLVLITIVLTFALIGLGGYVHNSGSSLACPDWPLCYGQVMPVMKGGVLIEHSHRMLATLVGFLSILICFFSAKKYSKNSRIFKFSLIALFLVIAQGILGGITVIYKLPTLVSTSHLGLSMIYFSTLVYLHHLIKNDGAKTNYKLPTWWNVDLKFYFLFLGAAVYFQILLGALMRHLGLGGACGIGFENSVKCYDMIDFVKTWLPANSEAQIHMTHRASAFIIMFFVFVLFFKFFGIIAKNKNESHFVSSVKKWMIWLILAIVVQVKLGILVIANNIPENITTLHLLGALACLLSIWKIYLNLNSYEKNSGEKFHSKVLDIISLTKPKLSGLVIFTAAIGLYMNPEKITFLKGMIALVTTSLIVAGACVLNCFSEKDEDAKMKRTSDRPLPSGRISEKFAFNFGIILIAGNILIQYLFINVLTANLALIATLVYIFLYTPLKKKSWLAVFVGAIPGAIPPLMGWTSVSESFGVIPLVLFGILFVWQLPHFLAISLYHSEDYQTADFIVLPNLKGTRFTMTQMAIYTLALLAISLVPMTVGYNSNYVNYSVAIGGLFLLCAVIGWFNAGDMVNAKNWARKYFWGSLLYLPAILTLIMIYKN